MSGQVSTVDPQKKHETFFSSDSGKIVVEEVRSLICLFIYVFDFPLYLFAYFTGKCTDKTVRLGTVL